MRFTLSAGLSLFALAAYTGPTWAADDTVPNDTRLEEVIVTSTPNLAGVVQERDSSAAFGIDKSLVDTPRSVTATWSARAKPYSARFVTATARRR
jgi:iron complex outermembrane receptor protein